MARKKIDKEEAKRLKADTVVDDIELSDETFTPATLYKLIDEYVVGQNDVKKLVVLSFINRMRRLKIQNEALRENIIPKNILMHGPTGVGKTEIARRIASITHSPFIKTEMTKFTEVGYAGRDTDSIIKDLVDITVRKDLAHTRNKLTQKIQKEKEAEIIEFYSKLSNTDYATNLDLLHNGKLNDIMIDFPFPADLAPMLARGDNTSSSGGFEVGNLFDLGGFIAQIGVLSGGDLIVGSPVNEGTAKKKDKTENIQNIKLIDAIDIMVNYGVNKSLNKADIITNACKKVEERGIVFLDEIDKLISKAGSSSSRGEISREGVQRDILPIIEGTIVNTKYGPIKTDYILFIAAGAFSDVKTSDLMAELQGRIPVKAELKSLTIDDFEKILTKVKFNLLEQQIALLKVDDINISFDASGIRAIAEYSYRINSVLENLGARRLHAVIEKVLEDISFNGTKGTSIVIDRDYVAKATQEILDKKINIAKYTI